MRAVLAAGLLLCLSFAGCTGSAPPPNLRPPCENSSPLFLSILADKSVYRPREIVNATLTVNNSGSSGQDVAYRSWEISIKSFDSRAIRTFHQEVGPDDGTETLDVPAHGSAVLRSRFQPFRVNAEFLDPLQQGTYYFCAVLVKSDGSTITGAQAFTSDVSRPL